MRVSLLGRRNDCQGVVESDGGQAPHAVLAAVEHRQRVGVLVAAPEMCVSAVRWVDHVGEGQGEDLLHLRINTNRDRGNKDCWDIVEICSQDYFETVV